jgi:hypothetical protein
MDNNSNNMSTNLLNPGNKRFQIVSVKNIVPVVTTITVAFAIAMAIVNSAVLKAENNMKINEAKGYTQIDNFENDDIKRKVLLNSINIEDLSNKIIVEYKNKMEILRENEINSLSKEQRSKILIKTIDEYNKFKIDVVNNKIGDDLLAKYELILKERNLLNDQKEIIKSVNPDNITNASLKIENIQRKINDNTDALNIIGEELFIDKTKDNNNSDDIAMSR